MRLVVLLSLLLVAPASAKPLHSPPVRILETTRALVLGTATGDATTGTAFVVHEVLWDPDGVIGARKTLQLSRAKEYSGVDVTVGHGAVVFFDKRRNPVYVAEPAAKLPPDAVKHHVLRLRGFYTFNAHLTTPAVATLDGLVRAMKTRRFEERIRAEVGFVAERAPAYVFEGRLVEGEVEGLTGPLSANHARVGPWDYDLEIAVEGAATTLFRGGFTQLKDGILVAALVPDRPFVPDRRALEQWRTKGVAALPLVVRVGDKQATLTLTGQTKGTLGVGLGIDGQLAGFIRQNKMGHRSQSSSRSKGKPPGDGWHIEIATAKGPLWITAPLMPTDTGPRPALREIVSLQTHLYLAIRAHGQLPIRLSGALTGEGTLSTQ